MGADFWNWDWGGGLHNAGAFIANQNPLVGASGMLYTTGPVDYEGPTAPLFNGGKPGTDPADQAAYKAQSVSPTPMIMSTPGNDPNAPDYTSMPDGQGAYGNGYRWDSRSHQWVPVHTMDMGGGIGKIDVGNPDDLLKAQVYQLTHAPADPWATMQDPYAPGGQQSMAGLAQLRSQGATQAASLQDAIRSSMAASHMAGSPAEAQLLAGAQLDANRAEGGQDQSFLNGLYDKSGQFQQVRANNEYANEIGRYSDLENFLGSRRGELTAQENADIQAQIDAARAAAEQAAAEQANPQQKPFNIADPSTWGGVTQTGTSIAQSAYPYVKQYGPQIMDAASKAWNAMNSPGQTTSVPVATPGQTTDAGTIAPSFSFNPQDPMSGSVPGQGYNPNQDPFQIQPYRTQGYRTQASPRPLSSYAGQQQPVTRF